MTVQIALAVSAVRPEVDVLQSTLRPPGTAKFFDTVSFFVDGAFV